MSTKQNYVAQLEFILARMSAISFSSLSQPIRGMEPSRELINWGIRVYVYSCLAHVRELLRSYALLLADGRVPACFVIARSVIELGAHAYYVHKHTSQYLKASDIPRAWQFLYEVSVGSRHMREYGLKNLGLESESEDFPLNPHIAKVIAAFDEYGNRGLSSEEYSFLSEFAHPSIGAFDGYREIDGKSRAYVFPDPAPVLQQDPRVGSVLIAAIAACQFCNLLLRVSGDNVTSGELKRLLSDFLVSVGGSK